MGIIKDLKNKRIMSEINRLNNNMLEGNFRASGVYKGNIYLDYDKIKLPNDINSKIHLYSDDGTLQIFILNADGEKIAVLDCLQTKKMREENEKRIAEIEAKEEEERQERKEQEEKEEKEKQKRIEKHKEIVNNRYNRYIDFLIENGADEEIINLPAIQDLIKDVISRGDPRVVFEGRSPIAYHDPNPDGTFDIYGRTNGPVVNEIYEMSYCNDGNEDHFIKLTRKTDSHVNYAMDDPISPDGYDVTDTETTYINKAGEIVDSNTERISK